MTIWNVLGYVDLDQNDGRLNDYSNSYLDVRHHLLVSIDWFDSPFLLIVDQNHHRCADEYVERRPQAHHARLVGRHQNLHLLTIHRQQRRRPSVCFCVLCSVWRSAIHHFDEFHSFDTDIDITVHIRFPIDHTLLPLRR